MESAKFNFWLWARALALFAPNFAAAAAPQGPVVSLLRPANNSIVPPTFDYNAAVDVPDHKAFSRSHKGALICLSLDGAEAECVDLWTSSLGASDVPLGPHSVAMWIVDPQQLSRGGMAVQHTLAKDLGAKLSEPTTSHFTVVNVEDWRAWVAAGAEAADSPTEQAAIAQEKRMVAPSLLEWHRLKMLDGSLKISAPWACSAAHSASLIIGIKTHAKGFRARDALRRTWLTDLGVAPMASACVWWVRTGFGCASCLLHHIVKLISIYFVFLCSAVQTGFSSENPQTALRMSLELFKQRELCMGMSCWVVN